MADVRPDVANQRSDHGAQFDENEESERNPNNCVNDCPSSTTCCCADNSATTCKMKRFPMSSHAISRTNACVKRNGIFSSCPHIPITILHVIVVIVLDILDLYVFYCELYAHEKHFSYLSLIFNQ